jgi:DNA-directed RNA polymerase specialized sigma24 family protein
MERKGGRPRGRALSELEQRYLRKLYSIRSRARDEADDSLQELQDFALELNESGCPQSAIAEALEVSPGWVSDWIDRARKRRGGGEKQRPG